MPAASPGTRPDLPFLMPERGLDGGRKRAFERQPSPAGAHVCESCVSQPLAALPGFLTPPPGHWTRSAHRGGCALSVVPPSFSFPFALPAKKTNLRARTKSSTFHSRPRRPASKRAAVSPGNPFLVQLLCSQQRSAGRRVGQGVAWCSVVPVFWGVWAEHTNSPSGLTLQADNCQS